MKVLIIEDDSIVAMHMKETIQGRNHDVVGVAKNAQKALKIAEKSPIDLVISDINIEGDIDGIECCKILQNTYHTSVILVSAYNDQMTLKNASTLDFSGYLIKPFREDELLTHLDLIVLREKKKEHYKRKKINEVYSYCPIHQTFYRFQEVIELTQKEKSFLEALLRANGAIVSYEHFWDTIWYGEVVSDEARRQLVYRLRQKLPDFPLKLVKGIGYKLENKI
ncbi:response regulator [Sulfurovum sp. zt1-1]|uniref:Response regulator n=1 Tax=Sulfurovum zhangzhouensis TaxID=3019067 RepID=A0ABT7R0K0_9BACT|nr:response regulator [Sulfurovum zhangzhouensis]MDM5272304.1 response regulator [Sulfurovum zhangzhouensis]